MNVKCFWAVCGLGLLLINTANAQTSDRPVVFSKTVLTIVPGKAIPAPADPSKLNSDAILLEEAAAAAIPPEAETTVGNAPITQEPKRPIGNPQVQPETVEAPPPAEINYKAKLEVKVRPHQVPLDSGLFTKYQLDATHALLTYFTESQPYTLTAENIYEPVDVLFIRNDGVIVQAVPEIMLAYLPETIESDDAIRAMLYLQGGLSTQLGIAPGDRVQHGMFTPRPQIQKVKEDQE